MKKHLRDLKPNRFGDLVAMNALYRPGPMEYIPDYIARKHGRQKVDYDVPMMEEYLSDTYGITVFQEQVMLLSRLWPIERVHCNEVFKTVRFQVAQVLFHSIRFKLENSGSLPLTKQFKCFLIVKWNGINIYFNTF